jgi:hypothetical protein
MIEFNLFSKNIFLLLSSTGYGKACSDLSISSVNIFLHSFGVH